VAEVQAEALHTTSLYRSADSQAVAALMRDLRHPEALVAHAAARALTALVRAERLPAEARSAIGAAAIGALEEPGSRRNVPILVRAGREIHLDSQTRLADGLAALLVELAGVADGERSSRDRREVRTR
jgi:hypothetical protein